MTAAALACALCACGEGRTDTQTAAPRPDVLLVTIDTLRADRVGGALTPAINLLGSRGMRFSAARTVAPLTLPAHVSLMTGVFPPVHRVRLNGVHRFDGSHPTLAQLFREVGYDTAAFVGAFVLDRQFGLNIGFATYDDQVPRHPDASLRLEAERPATEVADRAISWIQARQVARDPRPSFLWVHFYDPHAPYNPPPEARAQANGDAYGGEVAYADAQFGRLLSAVRNAGREARTLVAVMGDHGESLGEHGERTHGMLLYDGALRIPLVVAGPGVPAGERRQVVSLVDVAPTLLRLAGLAVPAGMQGIDLLDEAGRPHEVYAETQYPRVAGWSSLAALVEPRWKLIVADGAEEELYDIERDAAERDNVAVSQPGAVRAARARVSEITGADRTTADTPLSADARERLRALGYVAPSTPPRPPGYARNPAQSIAAWVAFEEAFARLSAGHPSDALPLLARLVRENPDASVFASTYGHALLESGRSQDSLAVYRAAVRKWPDDSVLVHDLAVAAQRAGRPTEAIRAEQAALVLDERNAAAHNGLGLLLIEAGRIDEARRAFDRAVTLDASNAEYFVNLGNARRAAGDVAGAEVAYQKALTLAPSSADALNGLGVLLVQADRPLEGIPLFQRALELNSDLWEARLNLGIANQEAGRADAARAAYQQVLRAPARFERERRAAATLLQALDRKR